jgi:dipeptidyl-peptidase-4
MSLCFRFFTLAVFACGLVGSAPAFAQGTLADYQRAEELPQKVRGQLFKAKVDAHWLPGDAHFWYRNDLAGGKREYLLVDAEKGQRSPAFDHPALAAALGKSLGKAVDADRLELEQLTFLEDRQAIRFRASGSWRRYHLASGVLQEIDAPAPEPQAPPASEANRRNRSSSLSPDGKWQAEIRDHNLWLKPLSGGEDVQLTRDGSAAHYYVQPIHWSPDSAKLVCLRTTPAENHQVHLIESSPRDQLQPKLHTLNYLKPGDRLAVSKPVLFEIAARKPIPLQDKLFPTPWSINDIRWRQDSQRFTFLYNQRGHQTVRIISIAADTGEAGVLVDETSKTFVDYAHKLFSHYDDAANEIIWMSERDGWNHLYLFDSRTGDLKNQITRGQWVVRGVDRVDVEKRQIWFRASGVYPEQDPYYIHHARINFDGSGLTLLTAGNGTHEITYSPGGKYLIASYSRVDLPSVAELRRTSDGGLVCELERADASGVFATGWKAPERFVAAGRDEQTQIYGVIHRPSNFMPGKKYPVVEYIYAGPHGSFTPKAFKGWHSPQAIAELGMIVVQCDGMGTSNRSKAFHDVCWKNLGDSGFPDRVRWIQAAAAKYPELDLSRVGIYGGSAGGQSALRALLAHGDFYHVAVADCGCHDNRMDKVWWNELWMGWPLGPHYAEQSNVTQAHKLQGKLLLVVGELDRNVDPASTLQVANALIQADKDFDLLLIPGAGHGSAETPYGRRRRADFLVRHLLGLEPRK